MKKAGGRPAFWVIVRGAFHAPSNVLRAARECGPY